MRIEASETAAGDGAWSFIMDSLIGFWVEFHIKDGSVETGRYTGTFSAYDFSYEVPTEDGPYSERTIEIEMVEKVVYV